MDAEAAGDEAVREDAVAEPAAGAVRHDNDYGDKDGDKDDGNHDGNARGNDHADGVDEEAVAGAGDAAVAGLIR